MSEAAALDTHAEGFHERGERKGMGGVDKITLVPVDLQLHFTEARVTGSADGASRSDNFLTHSRCS